MKPLLLLTVIGLGCGLGCDKSSPSAPPASGPGDRAGPARPKELDARLRAMPELSFIPASAQAFVRVDLAGVAAASPDPEETLKSFDFLLRAQQPTAWQVLNSSGITAGRELSTLYLVVLATEPRPSAESGEPYLIGATGRFDGDRLAAELRKTGPTVEVSGDVQVFVWKRADRRVGGALPPESQVGMGSAAVGVAPELVIFGTPELVKAAFASRGEPALDVRHGPLADELLAVDRAATVWGVAGKTSEIEGLERGRFHATLKRVDLEARFADAAQAEGFKKRLNTVLTIAALASDKTPLGAALGSMKRNAKMKLEGSVLTVAADL